MTATSADPSAFWNPGPLLISVTSPHPMTPQRTVSVPFLTARGAPPPLALARRRRSAALHSVASLGPQALSHCSRGPTPARSRSAAPLRGASLRRLVRAAGALSLPAGPDFSLTRLCQQLLDHVAVDVCQSEFPALELVGQLGVIETHQMK